MTVLQSQVSSTFWVFSTSASVSAGLHQTENVYETEQPTMYFSKDSLCFLSPCAFTKEKPHCYNQYWPNIPYILQNKLYRLFHTDSLPHPSPEILPQPAEAEQRLQQTADTKSLFTFSRTSCFCSRDRKITRIDWLIFCTKFKRANQNWRFGAMWRFKTAHHEDLKATREKRHDSCCHTRNFVHFHFLFCHI